MDLKEIQSLIRFVSKSGVNEVKLELEDFKITIKIRQGSSETTIVHQPIVGLSQAPVAITTPITPAVSSEAPVETKSEEDEYITITSPIIGTFYRRPSPDKPNFAEVGDIVQPETIVCIIEAMKLFNEIESEVSGKIIKILVDESSPVEFGQPLFLVDPS